MIRNLKVLGLALAAMFALTAVAASAASAQGVLTTEGGQEVTLTGTDNGANSFTAFGNSVSCPDSSYTGHNTSGGLLSNGASEVTVTAHYLQSVSGTANCDVTGGLSATIAMNGCDYVFDDFTTIETGLYEFTADLVCSGSNAVVVSIYAGHGHGFKVCTVTIGAQEGLEGFEASSEGGNVSLSGGTEEITASESGLCGSGEESEAEYNVNVLVEGENADEEQVGISLSDE